LSSLLENRGFVAPLSWRFSRVWRIY
jgi:hypothetical protein